MKHFNAIIILPLIFSALVFSPVYAGGGKGAGKGGGFAGGNRQSMEIEQGLDRANQLNQQKKQVQERQQIHKDAPGTASQEMKKLRERNEKQIREKINQNDAGAQLNEMKQIRKRSETNLMEKKQSAQSAGKSLEQQKSKRWYWPFGD